MPQLTESAAESMKRSASAQPRETIGPRGYGTTIRGGVKLKADPKTGKVSLDESDPYTRAYVAKQKTAKNGARAQAEQAFADRKAPASAGKAKP